MPRVHSLPHASRAAENLPHAPASYTDASPRNIVLRAPKNWPQTNFFHMSAGFASSVGQDLAEGLQPER